ncbi:hypothetical protein Pmani_031731 [Petrolisthes manimaculis]|uniref:Uncharacterized protein n=1 Tax=Petrolisthes manimaculis TaxID=1843537 RepID=A0AAE1NV43_9EUCA|nr:hypothetical protein Pmani_031731 [Petrolisthes manimaculis]
MNATPLAKEQVYNRSDTNLPTYTVIVTIYYRTVCVYAEQWKKQYNQRNIAITFKYGREPGGSSCWSWTDLSLLREAA